MFVDEDTIRLVPRSYNAARSYLAPETLDVTEISLLSKKVLATGRIQLDALPILRVSADGRYLVGAKDQRLTLHDGRTGALLATLSEGLKGATVHKMLTLLKGELLEVIEWTDDSRDTLSFRFPDEDKAIKNGAQLIVRESQVAQFVYLGEFGAYSRADMDSRAAYTRFVDPDGRSTVGCLSSLAWCLGGALTVPGGCATVVGCLGTILAGPVAGCLSAYDVCTKQDLKNIACAFAPKDPISPTAPPWVGNGGGPFPQP